MRLLQATITVLFAILLATSAHAADRPIKAFICAGQSNLVAAVREATGVADLPFIYGSPRIGEVPNDLSDLTPEKMDGRTDCPDRCERGRYCVQREF